MARADIEVKERHWKSGRAAIMTIVIAIAVTLYGFAVSLGGRPLFGRIFREE